MRILFYGKTSARRPATSQVAGPHLWVAHKQPLSTKGSRQRDGACHPIASGHFGADPDPEASQSSGLRDAGEPTGLRQYV